MEMDAILQLIETDEKTREAIQKECAKRAELKQAVEEEKKKLSDDAWADAKSKVEQTKKELAQEVAKNQEENKALYEKNFQRLTEMYNANKEQWKKELVTRIISVES